MKTFDKSEPIPAAAITLATPLGRVQPLLFTTQQFCETVDGKTVKNDWVISHLECSILRDWNTSTFQVILKCDIPNPLAPVPPLPDVSKWRKGKYPFLDREDEIRIYMGYIPTVDTVISPAMLDEIPFNVPADTFDPKTSRPAIATDPKKPLCPVFWGFIDKVDFVGTERGLQIVLTGRDRSRVFQDTVLIAVTSTTGSDFKNRGGIEDVGNRQGMRADILIDLANAAVGQTGFAPGATTLPDGTVQPDPTKNQIVPCWKRILGDSTDDVQVYVARTALENGQWPVKNQPPNDIATWVLHAAIKKMDFLARPRFHRWVERPPMVKNGSNSIFELWNKTPMECINFLAKTEERPIDFFTSHVNGDFCFVPRILDMSGFSDPNRFHRTYFFRGFPDASCPPHPGQIIRSLRVVSTSLGTFNRFVVMNAGTNANSSTVLANLAAAISYLPFSLQDRTPIPPCRTQIISDDSVDKYGNAQVGALITAMSTARVHGRDLSVAQMTVLGDPTFFPGEAVKLWGTVLHDKFTSTPIDDPDAVEASDRSKTAQFQEEVKETLFPSPAPRSESSERDNIYGVSPSGNATGSSSLYSSPTVSQNQTANIVAGGTTSPDIDALTAESLQAGRTDFVGGTDISKNILPVYKVRAVKHTLASTGPNQGFTTEISMVADY